MYEVPNSESLSDYVSDNRWNEVERFFNDAPFAQHLGCKVDLSDPACPKCEISTIKAFHLGGLGKDYVNGAVISGMFDLVIGLTGVVYAPLGNFASTNVNVRFLKPVDKHGFHMNARVSRKIGRRIFAEATLFDSKNEACAFANGELRIGIR